MSELARIAIFLLLTGSLGAQHYAAPAGENYAIRRNEGVSILPGGRAIAPHGRVYFTGPGPFNIASSPDGKYVVTADGGPNLYSLSILRQLKPKEWELTHADTEKPKGDADEDDIWRSVFMGLAFTDERTLWASEGNSGRIREIRLPGGDPRNVIDLNTGEWKDSYTGDIAWDPERRLLFVVDQANFRVAVVSPDQKRVLGSVRVGRLPFAIALSPDRKRAYVTNLGMFEYKAIPGATPERAKATGLAFPAFGFPSLEAEQGVERQTAAGLVQVPGLGDPNVPESNSVAVIDVADPAAPKLEQFVRTGLPFGSGIHGGSSPSGVLAIPGKVYVTNGHNDSITVIDSATNERLRDIEIRVPGLENQRGILPIGMAYYEPYQWLLVAEAGINAVAVIDTQTDKILGHFPVGWFPTSITISDDIIFAAAAKGHGTGPNAQEGRRFSETFQARLRRGSVTFLPIPAKDSLNELTANVIRLNGLLPVSGDPAPLPEAIQHVVLIVKENRTFDEVLGDITHATNGSVNGEPQLARFGMRGLVDPWKDGKPRLGLRNVKVTPNHHAIAERWAFSDNFYASSEVSVDGHHWLVGSYPNAWVESTLMAAYGGQKDFRLPTSAPGRLSFPQSNSSLHPEGQLEDGALWHHLERNGITFRNFGEGFELAGVQEDPALEPTGARVLTNVPMPAPLHRNTSRIYPGYNTNIPDQYRADQFIKEIKELYLEPGKELPQFIYIHLPNDHIAPPRKEDGYPYAHSYVADNDYALGRILEFLSSTPYWREMVVFVTEDDAQGGVDHIDTHRTVLLIASPYAKRQYVSHVNNSFPGLLKTIFRLLDIPPLNLFDATASDLSDAFTNEPDYTAYKAVLPDERIFDPGKIKAAESGDPPPAMDSPAVLDRQHRERN